MQSPVGAYPKQAGHADACGRERETSCQACQPIPWTRTARWWSTTRRPNPKPRAEVVVKGRNVEIPDHFRIYVSEKLSRLERFDRTIYLFDVELDHERNRRQRKNCQHVEITARGRGPVVRGEACADSFYAALESAVCKLESRLRRSKDRRKIHYGDKTPVSVAEATAIGALPGPLNGVRRGTAAGRRRALSTTTSPGGSCGPRNTRPRR